MLLAFSALTLFRPVPAKSALQAGLTTTESQIMELVNGTNVYNYDLELEQIAYNHALSNYSFRAAGSSGANATADWLLEQFTMLGLEAHKEPFEFTTWDVASKPFLAIDDDGNLNTTADRVEITPFQCEHYSWPTFPDGVFRDLVVLPLPTAASYSEIGARAINMTQWNSINTTGKILLTGREVRWDNSWQTTYRNKLTAQPPAAIVYTWWYDFMSFAPDYFSSAGGRPLAGPLGPYYWNLHIPVGFTDYAAGQWIRNRENSLNVSAQVRVEATIGHGPNYNIVARLNGTKYPDKLVIVSSHYDTVMSSGFCDNGAGTAGVLELARVFTEANRSGLFRPKYTILFIAFTGEELDLVGSTNYVMQHKAEMSNTVAVIQLDCIGSDNLYVTETSPGPQFDLDQLVLKAGQDIGVPGQTETPGGSDQETFRDPATINNEYWSYWSLNAGISDASPVQSSAMIISYPLTPTEKFSTGHPGWIHTSYDNSTSTVTLNWVETDGLANHVKVAALSVSRITASLFGDINDDSVVDMKDIGYVARRFGINATSPLWDANADIISDGKIDMKDIGTVARHFGETADR